jgi:glycosyltransferase involved in cell wall biosynthesis
MPNGRDIVRITIVARQLGMGGAERQLYLLATNLSPTRFSVEVLSLGASSDERWAHALREAGIPVAHVPGRTVTGRLLGVRRLLRRSRPDVIHAMHFAAGGYGVLGRPARRVPVVVGMRALPTPEEVRPSLWQRISLAGATVIACNSQAARDLLRARFPNAVPSVAVPNAVERAEEHLPLVPDGPLFVIGLVGRLAASKRVDRFLRSVAALRVRHPALRAEIVGDGPERTALQALSRQLGLDDVVTFAGETPALPVLRRFDVLCLTSDAESMPNVLLEAAAAGVPVVATRVGGVAEIVVDGRTGYLVDCHDDAGFQERVSMLLADPARRAVMGREARRVVERDHSVGAMCRAYEELYVRLMQVGRK